MTTSERARFDPFDVVVVPFPYADRLAEKRRPALALLRARGERLNGCCCCERPAAR